MLRPSRITATLTLVLLLAGCVTQEPQISIPNDIPVEPTLQQPETTEPIDLAAIAGRSIAIDPGHGGPWSGAVAPSNGLREADVNLGVALRLAALLREAGATVELTRTTNDVLVSDSMSADLAARAAMANRANADVFLSIHHNADIVAGSSRNDLEVYYAMHDPGASRDLAEAITAALATGFRQDATKKLLLPGNYKVLRECTRPAVLIETGYLTHDPTADRLQTNAGMMAEATAIANGLAHYFALDPPQVQKAEVAAVPGPRTAIDLSFNNTPDTIFGPSLTMDVNGTPVAFDTHLVENRLRIWPVQPLPNGQPFLTVAGRNTRGAAFTHHFTVPIDRAPGSIIVSQQPVDIDPGSLGSLLLTITVNDALGLPVRDGTPITCGTNNLRATTEKGKAIVVLPIQKASSGVPITAGTVTTNYTPSTGSVDYRTVTVFDDTTKSPVSNGLVAVNGQSFYPLYHGGVSIAPPFGDTLVSSPGYQSKSISPAQGHTTVWLKPVSPALRQRRIVLDPLDGGRNAGAIGPRGTRASDRALVTVETAAQLLRAAGAEVLVLRTDDSELGELTRVLQAESFDPEFYIGLTYGLDPSRARLTDSDGHQIETPPSFIAHYPGSTQGRRLAEAIGAQTRIQRIAGSYYYPVQQLSCPAILVQPADVRIGEVTAASTQSVAQALFAGLQAFFESATPK